MLMLATLACGGFQLRSSVTPQPQLSSTPQPAVRPATPTPTAAPTAEVTPTAAPEPTAVPAAGAGRGGVTVGKPARVTATTGLNVRDNASQSASRVGKLDVNATVNVTEGPVEADGYQWWKIDNGAGLSGWVASGPETDPWLVAAG